MKQLLHVNIRQFDEEEPKTIEEEEEDFSKYISDTGELDIDNLISDYRETEKIEETEETEPEEETEITEETDPEPSEEVEGDPKSTEVQDTENQKNTPDQAFAEMRRKAEQNEPLAKWVHDLATQQGFSDPKELMNAYEEQRIAKEAEAKGVPVDVYQRLNQLEQENKEATDQVKSTQFNQEVESTKQKYSLDDQQVTEVFQYMGKQGYDAGDLPFEDVYVLANRESLIKDAEERGRQSYLEEKKKQQTQATPKVGSHAKDVTTTNSDLDMSKEGIFKKFSEMGIEID